MGSDDREFFKRLNENIKFFRDISLAEEVEFRKWARNNFKVGMEIKEIWHPVIQDECLTMMDEFKWVEGKNT